jgi:hypothetical protein
MKWFLCANAIEYMRYACVAVSTCPPDLEPICVVDLECARRRMTGGKAAYVGIDHNTYVDKWLEWMKSKNVIVVDHKVSFLDKIKEVFTGSSVLNEIRGEQHSYDLAGGAFLRCDIPSICDKLGIKDEYVFYTDTDVFFINHKIDYLLGLKPKYLAASLEHDPYDWRLFNSGVMVLNVESMRKSLQEIVDHIPLYGHICFDQSVLNEVFKGRWEGMLLEYNWKPYWNIKPAWSSHDVTLVHMHGPKPFTPDGVLDGLKIGAWQHWMNHFFGLLSKTGM